MPPIRKAAGKGLHQRLLQVVEQVPPGLVVTYGQVARMAGRPGAARMVGWALHALPEAAATPWHRVINARGSISPREPGSAETQRVLLEEEGVSFDESGRIDLERYGWDGRGPSRRGRQKKSRNRLCGSGSS